MPITLEITLIVVLVALTVGLVPLLFQLRRTARSLDDFLLLSKKELSQIAEDVHASRLTMDHLMGSLQASMDDLAVFTQLTGDVGRTLKEFHAHFHNTLEAASRNLAGIIGGVSTVLALFKSQQAPDLPPKEQPS